MPNRTKGKDRFNYKHGATWTDENGKRCEERLYQNWKNMRRRCNDHKNNHYSSYGGRGIKVCDEWNDYTKFREWAYSNGYDETKPRQKQSLDRVDVDGDYCPENCRWTDDYGQANNRRDNVTITAFGETHTLTEWQNITGIPRQRIIDRIRKLGWDAEKALSETRNMNFTPHPFRWANQGE